MIIIYGQLPLKVAVWQQVVAALGVVVLQGLPIGEVIGGEGQTGRCGQRLPVHPHCAAEAGHCRGRRQQQGFRSTHTRTHKQTKKKIPTTKTNPCTPRQGTCVCVGWGWGVKMGGGKREAQCGENRREG